MRTGPRGSSLELAGWSWETRAIPNDLNSLDLTHAVWFPFHLGQLRRIMFKSILNGLANGSQGQGSAQTTSNTATSKGATPAQLRADIYSGMDAICAWIASGKAENGIDCRSILVGIYPDSHGSETEIGTGIDAREQTLSRDQY